MDIIYFFYGLAFVVMGIVLLAQPKKGSGFKLARGLGLLAWFGIIHGSHEFFEMWAIIKNIKSPALHAVDWLGLVVSYAFLLEGGRKLVECARPECPGRLKRLLALPVGWLLAAVMVPILVLSSLSSDFRTTSNILTRYLIGLPGSLMAGAGLLGYYRLEQRVLRPLGVRRFFLVSGLGFIFYGIFGGVLVSRGSFFPADWLNGETFRAAVGIPPQLVRALCALAISWGVVGMLRIFDWEMREGVDSALMESLPDSIFHVSPEGKFIGMNRSACEFYGLASPVEIMGKDAASRVAEGRDGMELSIRRAAAGETVSFEYGSVGKAGKEARWSALASPVRGSDAVVKGVLVVSRDITERKRAEADIREAYEMQGALNAMLLRSLKNATLQNKLADHLAGLLAIPWLSVESKGAVFLLDRSGKTLVLTAQQGLAPDSLIPCANVPLGCEGVFPHGRYLAPIMAGGRLLGVLNLCLKEGAVLSGNQESFIKAATDILAADILHAQVEEQLAQSHKMDSIGRLAGGVAHDFNNLLTAISGYAGFVLEGLAKDDPKRDDVKEILRESDRAAGLTRQLLAFSRKQILRPQVVDLNAAVDGTVKMLKRLIGEDIGLDARFAPRPCRVMVDPGQIEQVVLNLAINARDAMPAGGTIALETRIAAEDESFFSAYPDLRRGPLACLSVRDTGTGMIDEVKSRIFEPFFTTKEMGKGTGLGLSTVFGIIKQSGGEIEVESSPGGGATFRIYLPLVEMALPDKKDKDKVRPVQGRETVLLVDDDDAVRRVGERALIANGYAVLTAVDGPDALRVLERRGRPVDILITDVVMPGGSGRELAREISRRNMARRTLFISGHTDDAIVRHGVLDPGLAFLRKPFTPELLLNKTREALDGPADEAKA